MRYSFWPKAARLFRQSIHVLSLLTLFAVAFGYQSAVADTPEWLPIPEGYHNRWIGTGMHCGISPILGDDMNHWIYTFVASIQGRQISCNPYGYHPNQNMHIRYYVPNDCPIGQQEDALGHCKRADCNLDTADSGSHCVDTQTPTNYGNSCNNTANPINIPTGNKFFSDTDYSVSQPFGLRLQRYYNSATADSFVAWRFSYQQGLKIGTNAIRATRQDGKAMVFLSQNGLWVGPSQRREQLIEQAGNYELHLSNGVIETYDDEGRLISILDQYSGISHTLTYTGNEIIVQRLNEQLLLELNSDGNIIKATLPDNSVYEYDYTNANAGSILPTFTVLTEVRHNGQIVKRYHYTAMQSRRLLTGIDDALGNRIASVTYDSSGRARSSEVGDLNSGIERTTIKYNGDGTRTVTNSLGKEAIYHFTDVNGEYKLTQIDGQPSTHCAAANQGYTYDSNGFMASKTDWNGTVTTYIHNAKGQETSRVEASNTPQARTITTEWHTDFHLPTVITEPKRITRFTYDPQGRLLNRTIEPRTP